MHILLNKSFQNLEFITLGSLDQELLRHILNILKLWIMGYYTYFKDGYVNLHCHKLLYVLYHSPL